MNDFFRINLPYGIGCNKNDEWMAFNREYMPLGYNNVIHKRAGHPRDSFSEFPIYTYYKNISEKLLLELAESEEQVERNKEGKIITIYLYTDKTVPMTLKNHKQRWDKYFEKLGKLSKLKVRF